jgi:hypothetical protein
MTFTTITPRSRATAEALLVAADKLGLPRAQVRTSIRGYIVPDAVAAEYRKMLAGETEPIEPEVSEPEEVAPLREGSPDGTWKNEEIKAWAEAHEVDLGGATKKADMLAAVQATDTEEE